MSTKHTRKLVEVKLDYNYYIGYSINLNDILLCLEQAKKEIPEEFLDSAILKLDDQSYEKGDYDYYLKISYFKPETDEEYKKRVETLDRLVVNMKKQTEQTERKELIRLKKKYES